MSRRSTRLSLPNQKEKKNFSKYFADEDDEISVKEDGQDDQDVSDEYSLSGDDEVSEKENDDENVSDEYTLENGDEHVKQNGKGKRKSKVTQKGPQAKTRKKEEPTKKSLPKSSSKATSKKGKKSTPVKTQKSSNKQISKSFDTNNNEDGDSDEDDDDWEDVEDAEVFDPDEYNPVLPSKLKINLDNSKQKKAKTADDWQEYWIRQQINKTRKEIQLKIHRTHLLIHIAHLKYINSICDHSLVRALSLSITDQLKFKPKSDILENIGSFIEQFVLIFDIKIRQTQDFVSILKEIVQAFDKEKICLKLTAVMIAVCVLRSMKLYVRICYSFNPISFKPTDLITKNTKFKKFQDDKIEDDEQASADKEKKDAIKYWLELFDKKKKRWICVDLINQIVDDPPLIENKQATKISYIMAIDNDDNIYEVTARYASDWVSHTIKKRRQDDDWWQETLSLLKPDKTTQYHEVDLKEFDEIFAKVELPKRFSDYKNHPLFVLERDILKFQGIYPSNAPPLGFFRDLPVFSRSCVHVLRSRETWLREARSVKPNEEAYKVVKPRFNSAKSRLAGDKATLDLFGEWQTKPYEPPVAQDGIVPRNAYGNVEVFKKCMLPIGTVHMRLPGLLRIANKLKIDCVPAIVGFETNRNGSRPDFDGFVVCKEFKEILQDAWNEENENYNKNIQERRTKRIYDNWRRLIKGLIIRENLKIKYGN